MKKLTLILGFLIVAVVSANALALSAKSGQLKLPEPVSETGVVYSENRMLLELWSTYKRRVLEPDTLRALDKDRGNITTSEGQSYTMMRAVWMDDIETFDTVWQWTKDNMQRDDRLFSWRFGEIGDGKFGIQTEQGGNNTASDADVDIAFALIMASERWKDAKYYYDAEPIIDSIWQKQVVAVGGKPVLTASDIERNNNQSVLVNPSYFSPHAYKIFANIDPQHDWNALADNSYDVLLASAKAPLDKSSSAGLTPNWIRINRQSGAIAADRSQDSNYGYDAFRTPWRMALDWQWNKDPRAREVLARHAFLAGQWTQNGSLKAIYGHDGRIESQDEVPAAYGANLAYFMTEQPELAREIYETKLLPLYNPDTQSWQGGQLSYYDDNWAWFGMALYEDKLPKLTESYE